MSLLGIATINFGLTLTQGQGHYKVKRQKIESSFSRLLLVVESKDWYQKEGNFMPDALVKSDFGRQVALKCSQWVEVDHRQTKYLNRL